jgi:hypothetical protein
MPLSQGWIRANSPKKGKKGAFEKSHVFSWGFW